MSQFLLLALLSLVPPVFVFTDIGVLGHRVTEISLTEFSQEVLLLASALLVGCRAWQRRASRGFLVLMAGFFGCMLVREVDFFLDMIWHGFWYWPASLLAIAASAYAFFCCRNTVLEPMADFVDTKPFFYILFGCVFVLFFSRVFGSGAVLWKILMISDYDHHLKRALQEGLELFGYIFIAYGACLLFRQEKD